MAHSTKHTAGKQLKTISVENVGTLVRSVNMRRAEHEPDTWRPAGLPEPVRTDGWRPLQHLYLSDITTDVLFMRNGTLLGVVSAPASSGKSLRDMTALPVAEIGILDGTPILFETVETGSVKVLMRHRPTVYLTWRATGDSLSAVEFTMHGSMPELPDVMLTTAGETVLSQQFDAMSLSGSNAKRGALDTTDTRTAGNHLLWAYRCLRATALDAGLFIQPVIARCRMLDAAGDTVAVTAPVLLSPVSGMQCTGEITLTSSDGLATLSGGALTARAFRAQLMINGSLAAPWNSIVREIIVETTGELSPVDAGGFCSSSISNNGAVTTVRLKLPGVAASDEANRLHLKAMAMEALAGNAYAQQARITRPFAEAASHAIPLAGKECVELPAFAPMRDHRSYGAALHCHTAGTTVLADPLTAAFNGYTPASMVTATETQTGANWQAVATVKLRRADGREFLAVAVSGGSDTIPSGFSPLLSYPDPNACEMSLTIAVTDASGQQRILSETYPLTSLPGSRMAFHLGTALPALMPGAEAPRITIPLSTVQPRSARGEIEICPARLTASPVARIKCGDGAIAAIADAPRSRATWDFARRKLLVFGAEGTQLITLEAAGTLRSATRLDMRPVTSASAICTASRGNGPEILAVAGGDLISVTQSSVVTLMRRCGGDMPGWCANRGEIWLAGGQRPLRRITFRKSLPEETEVDESADGSDGCSGRNCVLTTLGDTLLLACRHGLFDTGNEIIPDSGVNCSLQLRYLRPTAARRLNRVEIDLTAASLKGDVTIAADNGSHVAEPLVKLSIDGQLNAPVCTAISAPARKWIESHLHGRLSPDALWRPIRLTFTRLQ